MSHHSVLKKREELSDLKSDFTKINAKFEKFRKKCKHKLFNIGRSAAICEHSEADYGSQRKCKLDRCPKIIYED